MGLGIGLGLGLGLAKPEPGRYGQRAASAKPEPGRYGHRVAVDQHEAELGVDHHPRADVLEAGDAVDLVRDVEVDAHQARRHLGEG